MEVQVLSRHEMPITCEDDIVLVRRKVRALATARGFDGFATTAVTTATSEIARNVWVHGGGGRATIEEVALDGRIGLRLEFRDDGPGIADIARVLRGGYSTAHSLGLGVSGSGKLVDEFEIASPPGDGAIVRMLKWARF